MTPNDSDTRKDVSNVRYMTDFGHFRAEDLEGLSFFGKSGEVSEPEVGLCDACCVVM